MEQEQQAQFSRKLSLGCRQRYFHGVFFSSYMHMVPLPMDLAVFRSLGPEESSFCVNFLSMMVIQLLFCPLSSTFRVRGEVVGLNGQDKSKGRAGKLPGPSPHAVQGVHTWPKHLFLLLFLKWPCWLPLCLNTQNSPHADMELGTDVLHSLYCNVPLGKL